MTKTQQTQDQETILFQCLSSSYRRYALCCLKDAETPLALADLAEAVTMMEVETSPSKIDPETLKNVYMDLYYHHLPKLEDADLVQYDQEQDTVALAESFGAVYFTERSKFRSAEDRL